MGDEEEMKCLELIDAINKRYDEDLPYPPGFDKGYMGLPKLVCLRAQDRFDCMQRIADNEADLVQLEPGMGYTGGEYYNMLPIMAEKYDTGNYRLSQYGDRTDSENRQQLYGIYCPQTYASNKSLSAYLRVNYRHISSCMFLLAT